MALWIRWGGVGRVEGGDSVFLHFYDTSAGARAQAGAHATFGRDQIPASSGRSLPTDASFLPLPFAQLLLLIIQSAALRPPQAATACRARPWSITAATTSANWPSSCVRKRSASGPPLPAKLGEAAVVAG